MTPKLRKVALSYAGFPPSWGEEATDSIQADKVAKAFSEKVIPTPKGKLYVQNRGDLLVTAMLNAGVTFEELRGVDFKDYFEKKVTSSFEELPTLSRRFTVIYGVGRETALNASYPSKILEALIYEVTEIHGNWVIIVSDLSYTEFKNKYKVTISNTIRFPPQVEKSIL